MLGREIPIIRDHWRPGDQKVFVADIRKAFQELNWQPTVDLAAGMQKLFDWIQENKGLFTKV
jgi:CDP-paratose 2-epimerase